MLHLVVVGHKYEGYKKNVQMTLQALVAIMMNKILFYQMNKNNQPTGYTSSCSTFIDNKESYKQIPCVEHFVHA